MKIYSLSLFIILFFIPSLAAQSASCDLMDKIGADIQISADETGVSSWKVLQLKQKLGAPSYTKILGVDTFYEWRCSPQSWLVVVAYDNQALKKTTGESCSHGKCLPFSVKFRYESQAESIF